MSEVDLTVLIPTRDRPEYVNFLLGRLLTLLRTSSLSWEVLVSENPRDEGETETERLVGLLGVPEVRYHAHRPAYSSGEENIFYSLHLCRGEWVWTCADDDVPSHDAVSVLEPRLQSDTCDLILCNAAIFDHQGKVVHSSALRSDISGFELDLFEGDVVEFVRRTGYIGFITTMSSTLFRRRFVLAVDKYAYLEAGPIYSHSAIYMEAFHGRRFVFIDQPLVNFFRPEDTDTRWHVLARASRRPLFFPWTLTIIRQLQVLEQRGVVNKDFLEEVAEANEVQRFTLADHTVFKVCDQVRLGILSSDPWQLFQEAECEELERSFAFSQKLTEVVRRATEINRAVAPYLDAAYALTNHTEPRTSQGRELACALDQQRISDVVTLLQAHMPPKLAKMIDQLFQN